MQLQTMQLFQPIRSHQCSECMCPYYKCIFTQHSENKSKAKQNMFWNGHFVFITSGGSTNRVRKQPVEIYSKKLGVRNHTLVCA